MRKVHFVMQGDMILAVFADDEDAQLFAEIVPGPPPRIVERTVFYGQPPIRGYNP